MSELVSELAAFQRRFLAALNDGEDIGGDRALARAVLVHRNTTRKAARDALAANYPVVAALTGADAFAAAASHFVEASPPTDPRLCLYGEGFSAFLSRYAPFGELSYLGDVARLERLVVESRFATDAIPLDGAAVARGLNLNRPLPLHPAARFARFTFPVAQIWNAHQDPVRADDLEQLDWVAETVLVTRPAGGVRVTVISSAAFVFLRACTGNHPLGSAAALAADADLGSLFAALIAADAFVEQPV